MTGPSTTWQSNITHVKQTIIHYNNYELCVLSLLICMGLSHIIMKKLTLLYLKKERKVHIPQ